MHPDDRERVQGLISDAISSGRAFDFDERIVRPDGAIRVLASHGHVHTAADGRPLRLVGICQDVTDSRRAERALRDYVGDDETLDLLRSYGVDFAQGYFLGRPAALQPAAALRDG